MSMGFKSPSMAVARKAAILLGLALLSCVANGASRGHLFNAGARRSLAAPPERKVFDVTAFGAKTEEQQKGGGGGGGKGKGKPTGGSGIPDLPSLPGGDDEKVDSADEAGPGEGPNEDNSMAFIRTWIAACRGGYSGPTKVVIPKGNFLIGPVVFQGPCNSSKEPIVVEVQGQVKASTDLSEFSSPEWVTFEMVDGLIVTGDGTFDGQGQVTWKNEGCSGKGSCNKAESPSSLKFNKVNNALVEKVTSVNPKFFHTHLYGCNNVTLDNVHLVAPAESPNTDGVHISTSEHIKVVNSVIATGDDCVSIGQGSRDILVNNITCGPGHGISVGSLGKYADELGVSQILVTNCTLRNTTNGARIKTWAGKSAGEATGIIYENIIMDHVQSPIVIDQNYGQKKAKAGEEPSGPPSKWKISDVHFRNIRGTSSRNIAVSLACSSANPCQGVEFTDIDLALQGTNSKDTSLTTQCFNAKIAPKGVQNPPLCR